MGRLAAFTTAVVVAGGTVAAATAAGGAGSVLGPGMMGGVYGPGGLGGYGAGGAGSSGTATPSVAQLTTVRDRIDSWLAERGFKGFKVAEVMAFTNNDYVAIHDSSGKPAFELLTDLQVNWVMEEPPSMMWNTRYGVMGGLGSYVGPMMGGWITPGGWRGWYGTGTGKVSSTAAAVDVANDWLAKADPKQRVESDSAMGSFPGYYTFDTSRDGKTYAMLSVDAATGAVWYHTWHGTFLAEEDF